MTPQPSTSLRVKGLFDHARERPEYTVECAKLEFTEALCEAMKSQGVSNCQLAKRMGVHKAAHALNCNVTIRLVAKA